MTLLLLFFLPKRTKGHHSSFTAHSLIKEQLGSAAFSQGQMPKPSQENLPGDLQITRQKYAPLAMIQLRAAGFRDVLG